MSYVHSVYLLSIYTLYFLGHQCRQWCNSWIFVEIHAYLTTWVTQYCSTYYYELSTYYYELKIIVWNLFEIRIPLKIIKSSANWYLVIKEHFCIVNPGCDVTKTSVNEIKSLSKMADI